MPTEHVIAYRKSERVAPPRSFEVLTDSGWYNAPVTGTYTIICIGGGGGGAGSFVMDGVPMAGQNGSKGQMTQMEVAMKRGDTVPYICGIGGKAGASSSNEFIDCPQFSGGNGGTTIFDNQVSAIGGQGGISGSSETIFPYFWYIDGFYVNGDNQGIRLWHGDGGVGGTTALDGKNGRDGCIIVVHPAEPIEN